MSRRAFLSSGAAAGAATVALGGTARAGTAPLNDIDAMVLQVAAAGAVFPKRFDTFERETAQERLTAQRVARARGRVSSGQAQQAERGAQLLLDRKLGGVDTEELLTQIGALAAKASKEELADLTALVSMAAATLADRIDPEEGQLAGIWIDGLAIMHNNGATPVVGG
jgi:hypothetical protein